MSFHKAIKIESERVNQGDIFKDISFIENYIETDGKFELNILDFPYIYILTQDCDLEQNLSERKKQQAEIQFPKLDKYLISILVAPLYDAQHVFDGNHLEIIKVNSEKHNRESRNKIKQNQNQRYHYLEMPKELNLSPLIIDFKHYFTIPLKSLEEKLTNRTCSIESLFRESISQRFSFFLSRIGLPNIDTDCQDIES